MAKRQRPLLPANGTIDFARGLGLVPSLTPGSSPQSADTAEGFVKTFERYYVYVHAHSDPETVLGHLLPFFFD